METNRRINNIADLTKYRIPVTVVEDINRRIGDWLAGGGSMDDNYIKQQLRYAEHSIIGDKINNH